MATLDDSLMALADPTRRAILDLLAKGELRMTTLAKPFDISLNSVSKHVRILERANLVLRRRAGREHILSCNARPLDEIAAYIETQRAAWRASLSALDTLLESQDAKEKAR